MSVNIYVPLFSYCSCALVYWLGPLRQPTPIRWISYASHVVFNLSFCCILDYFVLNANLLIHVDLDSLRVQGQYLFR